MTHQIFIANRRRQPKSLQEEFGDIPVFDVTFAGGDPLFSTLSPMYPHGDLPVPYSERTLTANSLEAIWQGLKVFEHEGARLDAASLGKSGDKNIKRPSTAKRGRVLGHQQGLYTDRPLLSLIEAETIKAQADREVAVMIATAEREARRIMGNGDAEATRIYASAYSQNPELFDFLRSMDAYRKSMSKGNDVLVLEPESEFFRYFNDPKGGREGVGNFNFN